MIVTIPFVGERKEAYKGLGVALKKNGQLIGNTLLIVSDHADEEEARIFADSIVDNFSKTNYIVLPPKERTAIERANDMFQAAMHYLRDFVAPEGEAAGQPMLYMDPRWRPGKSGWVDALQSEFFLRESPRITGLFTPVEEDGSKRFAGPLLIAPAYAKESGLIDFLQPGEHWMISLRWDMGKDAKSTELLGDTPKAVLRPPQQPKA